MKFNTFTILGILIWCLFMGVTAISIGFGALFPSMNLISKPFVCPRGEMDVEKQVYNPYPGSTITTLTWYCSDMQNGEKKEIGIFPMSISAGLIYGFLLFVIVMAAMWFYTNRSPSTAEGSAALERRQRESIRDAQYASHKNFDEPRERIKASVNSMSKLKELKDLRTANLISESEYQEKRAEILKNL